MNVIQKHSLLLLLALFSVMQACNTSKQVTDNTTTQLPKPIGVDPSMGSLSYAPADTKVEQLDIDPLLDVADVDLDANTLIASIERTKCYGKCPNYEAKVFASGLVLYDGKAYTNQQGLYEAYLLKNQVDSLISRADSLRYFELSQAYPENGFRLTELPSTVTFLKNGTREHKVTNNHNAPKRLRQYEAYFEALLETLDWKPVVEH